jgi:hypothetical protein
MKRVASYLVATASVLVLSTCLVAQERKPADASATRERGSTTPREFTFPAEVSPTDAQQAKLKELQEKFQPKLIDLNRKRAGILTDEQRQAQRDAFQKIREGNLDRQKATELLAEAVKLSPEQQKEIQAVEKEMQELQREINDQKMALLTDEQKAKLPRRQATISPEREFGFPAEIKLSDEQQAKLKAIIDELGPKIRELVTKEQAVITDEQRAARDAAFKAAREANKDRAETFAAVQAAMKLTDDQRKQMETVGQELRELRQQINERRLALLTDEQKKQLRELQQRNAPPSRGKD